MTHATRKGALRTRVLPSFLAFALCSLGYLAAVPMAAAAVLYVDNSLPASCAPGQYSVASRTCGGADGSGFTTFAAAIAAMQPGDTIDIRGGTYNTPLNINKSGTSSARLRFVAHTGETVRIDLTGAAAGIDGVNITARSYIDISGIGVFNATGYGVVTKAGSSNVTIADVEVAYSRNGGTVFEDSTFITLTRARVHHNNNGGTTHEGVTFSNVQDFVFTDSEVYDNTKEGVDAKYGSASGVIAGNHVYRNNGPNIYFDAVSNIRVYGNVCHEPVSNLKPCIMVSTETGNNPNRYQTTDLTIYNNVVYASGAGISFWLETDSLSWARFERIRIEYNTLVDNNINNWGGIFIVNGASNFGSGNTIRNNIVMGNGGRGIRDDAGVLASFAIDHNLFQNGESSTTYGVSPIFTTASPFVDRAARDYRLTSDSAARFVGQAIADITTDFNGAARPASAPDVGVYQYDTGTTPANTPPVAQATSNVTSGDRPLTVNFDGTGSSDPDAGDTITYSWDLNGDGTFGDATGSTASYTYTTAGSFTVTLRVTDSHGDSATDTIVITVAASTPPTPSITAPGATSTYRVGDTIAFSGTAVDPDTGLVMAASTLTWRVLLNYCTPSAPTDCHDQLLQTFAGVAGGTFVAPDYEYPAYLKFELTATKPASGTTPALSTTITRNLLPQTTTVTLNTVPAGLQVTIYGTTATAPVTRTMIVNAQTTVAAPAPQTVGGTTYQFASWSDGGGQSHMIAAAAAATTLTATYAGGPPPSVWNSWDVVSQSGSPQAVVTSTATGISANVDFYESTNDAGVARGALLPTFNAGAHPEAFNNVQQYWGPGSGAVYPYAGKSTVNRGSGSGETSPPAPLGVRDLQLHPPNNAHYLVAAFRVPSDGNYTISNLGVRRVHNLGGNVVFHVLNPQQLEIASLQATANQAWVVSSATYTLNSLVAGSYIYFAVDRGVDFYYDATEISWTVTADVSAPPPPPPTPAPTCTLGATPTSITQGQSVTLAWTTANASSLSIDNGVGSVTPVAAGSISRTPASTTTYTATATGPGGTTTCAATVTVTAPTTTTSVWNSWDVVTQAGSPQGRVTAAATGTAANIEFYESINNGGVQKGALFGSFNAGAHPETFNNVQQYWGATTGAAYPYAGKSTVNRGAGAGETGAPAPLGVRDLQLHPPNNLHYTVAAFQVPQAGNYTIANLGVRRVHNLGGPVVLHVFNAQQTEIANLTATANQAWAVSSATYVLNGLAAGSYIYFALDRGVDFYYDAAEIAWTVSADLGTAPPPPPPPPAATCGLSVSPASITQGATTTLSWTTANATSLTINQGVGSVTPVASGSISRAPAATTTYTGTATGAGGTGTCSATVTVTAATPTASVWNSWDVTTQSGSPQATVTAAATGTTTQVDFYESTNDRGVARGALFAGFTSTAHPEAFNNVQQYWGPATGIVYPYAGKSTVNRGSGGGETAAPSPLGVRDLQLHPPNNLHNTVAAFRVPSAGTYTISNLGVRRVHNLGGTVIYHVYNAQQIEIATLTATANQAWVTSASTYTLTGVPAGSYLYFAVDRGVDFYYDATEIAWTVTRTGP